MGENVEVELVATPVPKRAHETSRSTARSPTMAPSPCAAKSACALGTATIATIVAMISPRTTPLAPLAAPLALFICAACPGEDPSSDEKSADTGDEVGESGSGDSGDSGDTGGTGSTSGTGSTGSTGDSDGTADTSSTTDSDGTGGPEGVLVLVDGLDSPVDVAEHQGVVYVSASNAFTSESDPPTGEIRRVSAEGGEVELWATEGTLDIGRFHEAPEEDRLYWKCAFGPFCAKSFGGGEVVIDATEDQGGDPVLFNVWVFADEVVYATDPISRVHRTPFGGETEIVVGGLINPSGVAADGDYLYWADAGFANQGVVRRGNHDGSGVVDLAAGIAFPVDLLIDGDTLVFMDSKAGEVLSVPREGGEVTTLASGFDRPNSPRLHGDELCWVNSNDDEKIGGIWCLTLPDGEAQERVPDLTAPKRFDMSDDAFYVIEGNSDFGVTDGRVLRVPY